MSSGGTTNNDSRRSATESVWSAPLVPAAIVVTAGIVADRAFSVPLPASLIALAFFLAAWVVAGVGRSDTLPLLYLALAGVAFGSAWRHYRCEVFLANDIGFLVGEPPRPVAIRGILDDEPVRTPAVECDPLRTRDRPEGAAAVLQVTAVRQQNEWQVASGKVRLSGVPLEGLHSGDPVEVVGRLGHMRGPANPHGDRIKPSLSSRVR